jgi:hypothetical protein
MPVTVQEGVTVQEEEGVAVTVQERVMRVTIQEQ